MHMVAAGLAVNWPWLAMTGPILPSLHNWAWKTLDFYPVDVHGSKGDFQWDIPMYLGL